MGVTDATSEIDEPRDIEVVKKQSTKQILGSIAHSAKKLIKPRREDVYPWLNVVFIALTVGTIEYLPAAALAWTIPHKYRFLDWVISHYGIGIMTAVNIGLCMLLVVGSVLVARLVPPASGSGIPPLIAYLYNGKMTHKALLSSQLVLVKMVGVVLAISGGLAIGREGPALHIGAAVGDLANRFIDKVMRVWTGKKVPFDGVVKSNVVMMGATAGFASAFRSPIGGLMYCIEELASHWDIKSHMTAGAQTFLAAAVAAFVTDFIVRLTNDNNTIQFSSIIIFDGNQASLLEGAVYHYHDIPGFFLIAITCGVLSGVTTKASNYIRGWRYKNAYRQQLWVIVRDAAVIAGITALVFSMESLIYRHCKHIPEDDHYEDDHTGGDDHRRLSAGGGERQYVQYNCEQHDYSELASLSLSGEEGVIRHLLARDDEEFELTALCIFFVMYLPLSLIVRALPLPMGSFVPNLLLGSLIGRIVGEIAELAYPDKYISHPGVFALIGAAAMLGGWTRTMIAVVITLLEITGDVGMTVPLIVAVIVSRSISTKIENHSYSHSLFYFLIDDPTSDEPPILHPNDWEPPASAKRMVKRGSVDHGIPEPEEEDEDDSEDATSLTYGKGGYGELVSAQVSFDEDTCKL